MKIQNIFYILGVIFLFGTVWVFAKEFIRELPPMIKVILMFVGVVILFVVAELMREADK